MAHTSRDALPICKALRDHLVSTLMSGVRLFGDGHRTKEINMVTTIEPVMGTAWRLSVAKSFPDFLMALPELVPEGAVLYIESGGRPPEDTLHLLKELNTHEKVKVRGGTLFPRPLIYTVKITCDNMQRLSFIEKQHPTPVGVLHLHVYLNAEMLLSSYDAFLDPFTISITVPEARVREFSNALGCSYERTP